MAQRTDQRSPTKVDLLCYQKSVELTAHILSVCKPKDKNTNNKHIPKRNVGIGRQMMECAIDLGADILEADNIYVGTNIPVEDRIENYKERIKLQNHARRMTMRIEHIFSTLYYDKPFAESTTKYMMDLIEETRELLVKWKQSDLNQLKRLLK